MGGGITTWARATSSPGRPFERVEIVRRGLRPRDVLIDIAYCGICHSDVHHARAEFGTAHFPMVPGHEIAGVVSDVGGEVSRFRPRDHVGVGCMVDSCRECRACRAGLEQYCRVAKVLTYNAIGRDGAITQGGYSQQVVVDERFVVRVPDEVPLERAAPMMCAGVTVYSPMRHWGVGAGTRLGVVGFGGLGHVAVQVGRALGARPTVFSLTDAPEADARRLGAGDFKTVADLSSLADLKDAFDVIISTVPMSVGLDDYLELIDLDGVLVNLGVPERPLTVEPYSLFRNRRSLAGSLIGGMPETQEMIDFCAAQGVAAEVEVISADDIDAAFDRVVASDVRYRFVIDCSTI